LIPSQELLGHRLVADTKLVPDADLEYEAGTLASVLSGVDRGSGLRMVILDACGNNPLGERQGLPR
jgi:hypothetical protein